METQSSVQSQAPSAVTPTGCCAPFDPSPWQDKEITWNAEPFIQDHVRSMFYVPLRLGKHIAKNQALIDAAGAAPDVPLMLSDEKSPWGSELYIRVRGPVPGARNTSLSGTFLTRVFEGPFSEAPRWAANMRSFVAAREKKLERLYYAYTTCPACAEAYGKNYVILFAKVG
jgi:hypothetical protein